MNRDFEIYRELEEEIPTEDKARLEGYLEGRAQAVELEKYKNKFEKEIEKLKD